MEADQAFEFSEQLWRGSACLERLVRRCICMAADFCRAFLDGSSMGCRSLGEAHPRWFQWYARLAIPTLCGGENRSYGRQREQVPQSLSGLRRMLRCCAAMNVAGMAAHLLDGQEGRGLSASSGGGKALLVNGYRRKRSTTDPDLIEH